MNIIKKQIAYNRSTRTQGVKYIVIHDTGNTGRGANADTHFSYWNSGDKQSSADFLVDDSKTLQINDYTKYYSWHCGDGSGKHGVSNGNSIGIEICINSDGNYTKAYQNTVELVRHLMTTLNIGIDNVVRHYDASRKNCPATMSGNGWAKWYEFKNLLTEEAKIMIYNYIDKNMPDWARPTIQKLVHKGIIQGNENGELELEYKDLRLLVILDRANVF